MKTHLLGVTPRLHEERASKLRGTLNRASILIVALIIVPTILWALHGLGVVPDFFSRKLPPTVLASIGTVQGSIEGASGFMIDPTHFLTTERSLKGDGSEASENEPVSIAFSDSEGQLGEPIEGKTVWLGEAENGIRLVLVKLQEDRADYVMLSEEKLVDASRLTCAGFHLDPDSGDLKLFHRNFTLTLFEDALGSAEWGESEAPPFEAAPVLIKGEDKEYVVNAILSQGALVSKLNLDQLREAGVDL